MSDGTSGGLGGVLFESKDAVKKAVTTATQQITGKSPAGTIPSFPPLEKIHGGKSPAGQQATLSKSQQQYQQMKSQNDQADKARIAELTRELHNKMYGEAILKPEKAENSLAKQREERVRRETEEQAEHEKPVLPGQLHDNVNTVSSTRVSNAEIGKGVQ